MSDSTLQLLADEDDALDRLKVFQSLLEAELEDLDYDSTANHVLRIQYDLEEDFDDMVVADDLNSKLSALEQSFTSPNKQFSDLSTEEQDAMVLDLLGDDPKQPATTFVNESFFDKPSFERQVSGLLGTDKNYNSMPEELIMKGPKAQSELTKESLKANFVNDEDNEDDEDDKVTIDKTSPLRSNPVISLLSASNKYRPELTQSSLVIKASAEKDPSSSSSSSSSITPNICLQQPQAILDDRIQGDYSAWQSGPRLTPQGLKVVYSGLRDTVAVITDSRWRSMLVIECILRPDVSATDVIDVMSKVVKASSLQTPKTPASNMSYTIRPGHLIVETSPIMLGDDSKDWDMLDCQICISIELRQRVLLCQFFKYQGLPSETDSSSSDVQAMLSDNSTMSPTTKKLARILQRMMTQQNYSFSCLYAIDSTCVASMEGPEGLDLQFTTQLENMFKEKMIADFRFFSDDIDQKTQEVVYETEQLKRLLSPIFRQHGLSMDNIYPDVFDNNNKSVPENVNPSTEHSIRNKCWCDDYIELNGNQPTAAEEFLQQKREKSLEGLTKCVVAIDKLSLFFSSKCELKVKGLQYRKSEDACFTLSAMSLYRRKMFRVLVHSDIARTSTLTKVFIESFKSVVVSEQGEGLKSPGSVPLYLHLGKPLGAHSTSSAIEANNNELNTKSTENQEGRNAEPTETEQNEAIQTTISNDVADKKKDEGKEKPKLEPVSDEPTVITSDKDLALVQENNTSPSSSSSTPSKPRTWMGWINTVVTPLSEKKLTEDEKLSVKDSNLSPSVPRATVSALQLNLPNLVVMCYGACFLNSTPATFYITPQYLCLSCGFPGFTFITREIYPIRNLHSVNISSTDKVSFGASGAGFIIPQQLQPSSLLLTFTSSSGDTNGTDDKILKLTPAVLECHRIRTMLTELKEMEAFEWILSPSDPKPALVGSFSAKNQTEKSEL